MNADIYGDPCQNVYKFIQVEYLCEKRLYKVLHSVSFYAYQRKSTGFVFLVINFFFGDLICRVLILNYITDYGVLSDPPVAMDHSRNSGGITSNYEE